MTLLWLKVVLAAAAGFVLIRRLVAALRADRARYDRMLDAFLPHLAPARVRRGPEGWPLVEGRLEGKALTVRLVPDSLAYRALPRLWLEARWARPHPGVLRLLVRPAAGDYFPDDRGLAHRFAGPASWPVPVEACGSGPEAFPLLHRLEAVDLAGFPALKQLLLTPREIRLTLRCGQADLAAYRVLRAARFDPDPVPEALVQETLGLLRSAEAALAAVPPIHAALR